LCLRLDFSRSETGPYGAGAALAGDPVVIGARTLKHGHKVEYVDIVFKTRFLPQ